MKLKDCPKCDGKIIIDVITKNSDMILKCSHNCGYKRYLKNVKIKR